MKQTELLSLLEKELKKRVGTADTSAILMDLIQDGVIQERYVVPYLVRGRLRRESRNYIGRMNVLHRDIATEFDVTTVAVHQQSILLLKGQK